jgi:WD40 repeat protein
MSEELGNNNADQSVSDGHDELPPSAKCQHELGVCIGRKDHPVCSSPMSAREEYMGFDWYGGDVGVVAISADGKIGASAVERESDEEGEIIRIWNVATGKSIRDLKGIEGEVDSLAMSACGERVVAGLHADNKVRVWDISTGECVCDVDGGEHGWYAGPVSISANGRLFMDGHRKGTQSRVWKIEQGKCTNVCKDDHPGKIVSVSLTATGKLAMTCSQKLIRIVSVATGKRIRSFRLKGSQYYTCGVISSDGAVVAAGISDNCIDIINVKGPFSCRRLSGHMHRIMGIAMSFNTKYVVSGSCDDSARVWSVDTGKCIRVHVPYMDGVDCVAISGNGGAIVMGTCADVAIYPPSKEYIAERKALQAQEEVDEQTSRDTAAALADRDPKKIKLEDE